MKDKRNFTLLGTATALLAGFAAVMAIPYFFAGTPTTGRIPEDRPIHYEADGAHELPTPSKSCGSRFLRCHFSILRELRGIVNTRLQSPWLRLILGQLVSTQLCDRIWDVDRLTNWWEETKMAFEQEQVDSKWADATGHLFESDIAQLAEQSGFSLVYTECRTTRCSAVVRWPSYAEASGGFDKLLHHAYKANCTKQTLLPEPSDEEADQPYEMTVIYDCNEWRNQG